MVAANVPEIPFVGYLELDIEVFDQVICKRRVLVILDPPNALSSAPDVLGMNVITECYHESFG